MSNAMRYGARMQFYVVCGKPQYIKCFINIILYKARRARERCARQKRKENATRNARNVQNTRMHTAEKRSAYARTALRKHNMPARAAQNTHIRRRYNAKRQNAMPAPRDEKETMQGALCRNDKCARRGAHTAKMVLHAKTKMNAAHAGERQLALCTMYVFKPAKFARPSQSTLQRTYNVT